MKITRTLVELCHGGVPFGGFLLQRVDVGPVELAAQVANFLVRAVRLPQVAVVPVVQLKLFDWPNYFFGQITKFRN